MINEWFDLWFAELHFDWATENDERFLWSWDAAFDEDVTFFNVALDDGDVLDGDLLWSPVAGHFLAWDDAVVIAAIVGKGTDSAMISGTVAFWSNVIVVFFDGTTVAVAFVVADDIDDVACREQVCGEGLADGFAIDFVAFELKDVGFGSNAGFGEEAFLWLAEALFSDILIADDKGFIAVFLDGPLVEDDVWKDLDEVTGYIVPSGAKTSVMPIFLPIMDFMN